MLRKDLYFEMNNKVVINYFFPLNADFGDIEKLVGVSLSRMRDEMDVVGVFQYCFVDVDVWYIL